MTSTVRAAALHGYPALVRSLGGDPRVLAGACGLSLAAIDDDEQVVPLRQCIYLLEHTAEQLNCPAFGLHLSRGQGIEVLGPLAVAMQNAGTVAEAVRCCARYLYLQSPALTLELRTEGALTGLELSIRLRNMPQRHMRQAEDLALGLCHGVLGFLVGDRFQPLRIELPPRPPAMESTYRKHFVTEVLFGCPAPTLYVHTALLDTPLRERSESLCRIATDYLAMQHPSPDGRLAGRVELAIRHTLGTDSCNREAVARAMAVHPRTLQRQLSRERSSFEELRDGVRRERAGYYLRETAMPLSQVAGLLGYSDQAVLTRSCHRWFSTSPLKLRQSAQAQRSRTQRPSRGRSSNVSSPSK